jgi:hypothetical protein
MRRNIARWALRVHKTQVWNLPTMLATAAIGG